MKKIDTHTLFSALDADLPSPVKDSALSPSPERIKALAMAKLSQQLGGNPAPIERRIPMRRSMRIVLAAAIVVVLASVTVFAAMGGLDYFRSIFGDSADTVGAQIETPLLSTETPDYRLTLEASLSDGYQTNLVMSLTPLSDKKVPAMEQLSGMLLEAALPEGTAVISYSLETLDDLSTSKKSFYRMTVTSEQSHNSQPITITVSDQLGGGELTFTPQKDALGSRKLTLDPAVAVTDNYSISSIQLSPLGALVIGSEQAANGGLPNPVILVKLQDGSTEEIMPDWAFDQSDSEGTTMGGGGAVVGASGANSPFVSQTFGRRNPDGQIITESGFSRLLPVEQVVAVVIGGTEYPFA